MKAADLPFEASLSALSEIAANARIRAAFERLILPNAQVFFTSEYVEGGAKEEFRELLTLKTTDAAVSYRGLLILVCTVLEYFCKQVIENSVIERAAAASGVTDLSDQLVAANFAYTGLYFQKGRDAFLQGAARPLFKEFAESLASCSPASGEVKLNARVFTEFLGNCTPKQLETRFGELGLDDPFGDRLGSVAALKAHFGGGGVREVAKKSRADLDKLIERRNGLVHSATISETVTVDELLQAVAFGKALIAGLREIVQRA